MTRIPASIERLLAQLFPRAREREQFVAETLRAALKKTEEDSLDQPESIGGTIHLFTDGGSRGNPGKAAIGCVLEDPLKGEVLREHFECIGTETNNVAEYRALIEGLKLTKRYHPNTLVCHLDSELVVKQVNGEYRIKMHTLQPLYEEIKELAQNFPNISFVYIPRDDNHRADSLVNQALDSGEEL
jgi:ribonuclease HI